MILTRKVKYCHSREGGNPVPVLKVTESTKNLEGLRPIILLGLDSRLRGNDSSIMFKTINFFFVFLFLVSCQSSKPGLDLRKRVKTFTLNNGLKVILLKREGAPVFTSYLRVKVGNVEEQAGSYGLAHFFEHMAFKGTQSIGTKDWKKENKIMQELFEVGTKVVDLKKAGATEHEIQPYLDQQIELQKKQDEFIVKNEFTTIIQRNGGADLNATTSNDFTTYHVSFPSHKMELWAYLESSRFIQPVLREFFAEKQVVAEERRLRVDNTPNGQLAEAFLDEAFDKSPYKVMVIGPAKDIQSYTPKQAQTFYDEFYIPKRMVLSVVGNFDIDKAESLIRNYFGKIPNKKDSHSDPKVKLSNKKFPREVYVTGPEKPRFYMGYHRPNWNHDDDIVMDVIQNVLCDGKTSRFYQSLILKKQKAQAAACYASFPGGRLDNLFLFYGIPLDGVSNKELQQAMIDELNKLIHDGPSEYELQKVKNQIDADLVYSLQSNSGLASKLSYYQSLTGDWTYLYDLQDRVHKITADDVKRVAKKYFVATGQVTAFYQKNQPQDGDK